MTDKKTRAEWRDEWRAGESDRQAEREAATAAKEAARAEAELIKAVEENERRLAKQYETDMEDKYRGNSK
jgi:hypothetical protein